MMELRQYEKEFDKYFFNMDYSGALEVVGALKYADISRKTAKYLEMLVYYEQGSFEKIRREFKNKRIDRIEERELYLASLVELHLYDEFESAYRKAGPISEYCMYYIAGLLVKQGRPLLDEKHDAVHDYSTYFERRYRWFIANQMVDIFNVNEEKILMIDSGMDQVNINSLRQEIERKFETVRLFDKVRDEIKRIAEKDEHIPVKDVLHFPLDYCAMKDGKGGVKDKFENIYDIVNYLELCRRVNYVAVELEAIGNYGNELTAAVRNGNMFVVNLLKDLYIDVGYLRRYELADGQTTVADIIYSILEKDAPYIIQEIDNHTLDKTIESKLTPRGVFAYNAAKWQFCNTAACEYGTRDAGMLCLSYIRIIELEINERIVLPLCETFDISQAYNNFTNKFSDAEKKRFDASWGFLLNSFGKVKIKEHEGLEMGPIFTLFDSLKDKKYKKNSNNDRFAKIIKNQLMHYLSDDGLEALEDGRLAQMVEPSKRKEYRNPPAHTRYVGLEVALACREYVEKQLINLDKYCPLMTRC